MKKIHPTFNSAMSFPSSPRGNAVNSSHASSGFRRGFALIFSLIAISLLVALVIGLLLFVRSQQRAAQPVLESLRAQANTKLASSLALAQLQSFLGPDQRATGSALNTAIARGSGSVVGDDPSAGISQLDIDKQHWVAVWDTSFEFNGIPYPVIGKNNDSDVGPFGNRFNSGIVDRRYSQFGLNGPVPNNAIDWMIVDTETGPRNRLSRPNLLRGFLVSGINPDPTTASTQASATLAKYFYADSQNPSNYPEMEAQAELVDENNLPGMQGSYAFLALDQSLKTAVRKNPWDSASGLTGEQALAAEILSHAPALSALDLPNEVDSNLASFDGDVPLSLEELVVFGGSLNDWLRLENALTVTPNLGILSNPRLGRLKRDLTAFLKASDDALEEGNAFVGTSVEKRDETVDDTTKDNHLAINPPLDPDKLRPVRNYNEFPADNEDTDLINPIIPGDEYDELGPTFDALRQYLRLGQEINRSGSQNSLPSNTLFTGTRVGKRGFDWESGWQSVLSKHRGVPVGNSSQSLGSKAQRIHPLCVEAGFWWNFTREEGSNGDKFLTLHLYPKVVLWNPYNVTIPAQEYIMTIPGSVFGEKGVNFNRYDSYIDFMLKTPQTGLPKFYRSLVWRDIFDEKLFLHENFYFHLEETQLAPGECIVFTANPSAASVTSPDQRLLTHSSGVNSAPYNNGNILLNTLSAKKLPDTSSYHFISPYRIRRDLADFEVDDVVTKTVVRETGRNNLFFKRSENFYLHAIEPSFSGDRISISDMRNAAFVTANAPLIQRIYSDLGGSFQDGKNLDYVAGSWQDPVNAYTGTLLDEFSVMGDVAPPRLWHRGTRLHMMNESTEYDGFRSVNIGVNMPEKMLRRPMFTTHNFRHHLNARSAASPYIDPQGPTATLELFMLHSGGMYYLPWGDPPFINDPVGRTDVTIDPETGNASASPYIFSGLAGGSHRYVLFDVPAQDLEPASLLHLRDADFSPFSWHSSYPLGSGMAAPQADYSSTFLESYANEDTQRQWSEPEIPTFRRNVLRMWDVVAYDQWTEEGEQLLYDLGYKLNHYLLDDYFLSTLPYNQQNEFAWDWQSTLTNSRLEAFPTTIDEKQAIAQNGFDLAASALYNEGAFNVNSTDVNAWIAFLASTRNKIRNTTSGGSVGSRTGNQTLFARFVEPHDDTNSINSTFTSSGAHSGVFLLNDNQIRALAENIVAVNLERGPALTVADFVSRPLVSQALVAADETPISRRSRLEEAIFRSGINSALISGNVGSQSATIDKTQSPNTNESVIGDGFRNKSNSITDDDNLMEETLVEDTVTWGMPGFLTQQDLLEPLLPSITTRGDTFIIRCLGTSQAAGEGARRYLEITLQRTPEFLHTFDRTDEAAADFGNLPEEALLLEDRENGTLSLNDQLSPINQLFGRRFQVVSQRWIRESDL